MKTNKFKDMLAHPLRGKDRIDHSQAANCHCPLYLFGPRGAKHVRWETETGVVRCFNCGAHEDLPLPVVRLNWWSRQVYPDYDALADDLVRFLGRHQDCPESPEGPKGPGISFDPGLYLGSSKVRIR